MPTTTPLKRAAAACLLMIATAAPVSANMFVNPGFEAGFTGWSAFGNAFPEVAGADPCNFPLSGVGVAKMFGNFTGGFDVTGIFQEFPTTAGITWSISSNARHCSADPLTGIGAASCATGCSDNWVVQKLAFFDAGNNEIGAAEDVILDGTYTANVWHAAAATNALAPVGTVKVQAFILFLQPAGHQGAAFIDDVMLTSDAATPTKSTSWGRMKTMYR